MGFTFTKYNDHFGFPRTTQYSTSRRDDLDYDKAAKIIQKRFKEFDVVNIMPMNVSDGTEAYCLANALIKNEGYDVFEKRYSQIKASDVCPDIINNYGRQGLLHLNNDERYIFNDIDKTILREVNREDYTRFIIPQIGEPEKLYKLNPEYTKHFDFSISDFQTRLPSIKDEGNSIVLIRNCLKQSFGDNFSFVLKLVNQLETILKGNSLFITGDYDIKNMPKFREYLKNCFQEIEHNIWELKAK